MSGNGHPSSVTGRTIDSMSSAHCPDQTARYRALCSRDARFDGGFFVGVTSTGVYCRPICRVRTPRLENCRFFDHAAQAEREGFRPCLRCRPELAPRQRHWSSTDAAAILTEQACAMLDDPQSWDGASADGSRLERVAGRLGVSDRHLRRVFEACMGVSPLQYLQTCRLLVAKQLLTDTKLSIADVADASGFGSQRRFNAAFSTRYRMNPSLMRRQHRNSHRETGGSVTVRLSWRPPLEVDWLMHFLAKRELSPLERFDASGNSGFFRTMRLASPSSQDHRGWISGFWDQDRGQLVLQVSEGLLKVLPSVVRRVREWLDLDADPAAIHTALRQNFPEAEGLRVPGCLDGFELAVRAILGQQITVAAARTIGTRLVQRLGEPVETPPLRPDRLFPTPEVLARVEDSILGEMGIVVQRQRAIKSLATAVLEGQIDLNAHTHSSHTVSQLESMPGIGAWTAQYIAMRALRNPDAWPPGDVALHSVLGLAAPRTAAARRAAEQISDAWRPWRSYAVIRAWAGLHATPSSR